MDHSVCVHVCLLWVMWFKKGNQLNISITALHLLCTPWRARLSGGIPLSHRVVNTCSWGKAGGRGGSKGKTRKGNVGQWSEPTFCQRDVSWSSTQENRGSRGFPPPQEQIIRRSRDVSRQSLWLQVCQMGGWWNAQKQRGNCSLLPLLFFPCHCHVTIKKEGQSLLFQRGDPWSHRTQMLSNLLFLWGLVDEDFIYWFFFFLVVFFPS